MFCLSLMGLGFTGRGRRGSERPRVHGSVGGRGSAGARGVVRAGVRAGAGARRRAGRAAVGRIRLLAKHRFDIHELIGVSGAIPSLVPLLRSTDPVAQESAVTAQKRPRFRERCDETKPFVRDEYGLISNEVLVENNVQPVVQPEPSIIGTNMDKGTILKTMPPEPSSQNPSMQIAVIRHVVSGILLHNTIYDVVPLSSKLTVLDTQLPVKQAFKIVHDEMPYCILIDGLVKGGKIQARE
uniref:Uncharacterized protein n=1 Tax=Zea mays TaxID=4577 RepID=A0A804QWV2_MAIZE